MIIFPLIWPAKCVQSFECKGDGCFIYIISFFTCDKSSSLSSVYAWWSLELVFDPPEDIRVSSGSSSIVVSLDLWWVAHISPEGSLSVPSKVCFSNIGLLTFDPILGFSSSPPPPHTHIFYSFVYSYIFLGITSSSSSSSFLSPIINNSQSLTVYILFRNLILLFFFSFLFFFLSLRQFDVCEIYNRSLYQTYHPNYYRYVFLFFVKS